MMHHRIFLILIGSCMNHYAYIHQDQRNLFNNNIFYFTFIYSTARICNETCTVNGVTFLKGFKCDIPILKIHMSPEYWDQPEVFNPKRLDLPNQKLLAINDNS